MTKSDILRTAETTLLAEIEKLPPLSTATELAGLFGVTSRCVLKWKDEGKITPALVQGAVIRFSPLRAAMELGVLSPETGMVSGNPAGTEVNEAACDNGLTNDAIADGGR